MRIIYLTEIDTFLRTESRARSLQELRSEETEFAECAATFRMPESFGKVLATSRIVTQLLDFERWALLIVEERGIWPNWEDLHAFRCLLAEAKLDSDVPIGAALMFARDDEHRLFSFFQMMSNFHWGFRLIDDRKRFHYSVTHDDDAFFYSVRMTAGNFGRARESRYLFEAAIGRLPRMHTVSPLAPASAGGEGWGEGGLSAHEVAESPCAVTTPSPRRLPPRA